MSEPAAAARTAPSTQPPASPDVPALPVAAPRPGWTTTEFWSSALVHLIALVTVVLSLTGGDEDFSTEEALIPAVAVVISGVVSVLYSRSRTRAKLMHVVGFVDGVVADLHRVSPLLERDEQLLGPAVEAVDPAAVARLRRAAEAYQQAQHNAPRSS